MGLSKGLIFFCSLKNNELLRQAPCISSSPPSNYLSIAFPTSQFHQHHHQPPITTFFSLPFSPQHLPNPYYLFFSPHTPSPPTIRSPLTARIACANVMFFLIFTRHTSLLMASVFAFPPFFSPFPLCYPFPFSYACTLSCTPPVSHVIPHKSSFPFPHLAPTRPMPCAASIFFFSFFLTKN